MKIGMVGMGKLGLPVALAIESKGHDVCCTDINPQVSEYLQSGEIPYREINLTPLLAHNKIKWHESIPQVVRDSDITFIAVQTPHAPEYEGVTPMPPEREDFNYSWLVDAVRVAAAACQEIGEKRVIAVISTCLPGTFNRIIKQHLNEYTEYVYTPQFIAMGTVLYDYLNPEFNLVGVESAHAAAYATAFYKTINSSPTIKTDITTAEGIKVSYNTWITAKTVIANVWGEMCERLGMDFRAMRRAWSMSDRRLISPRYMDAGMSDGGGCHPRDNIALSHIARELGMSHDIWDDLMRTREDYEKWHAELAATAAASSGLPLVILGTAFKPETDIETGSPALLMGHYLTEMGVEFTHCNDVEPEQAVYFVATRNTRYMEYEFPTGAIVLDPFGYIPKRRGVKVMYLGRRANLR